MASLHVLSLAAAETARFAPMAVAAVITFRIANFPDLGIEGAFLIGGASTVWLSNVWHLGYSTAPIAMILGALMGGCTATLYVILRVHPLFSGIFMLMTAKSIGSLLVGVDASRHLGALYSSDYFGALFAVGVSLLLLLFFSTRYGVTYLVAGNSPQLIARLGGYPNFRLIILIAAGSAIAALGGHVVAGATTTFPRSLPDMILVKAIGWLLMGEAIIAMLWQFVAIFRPSDVKRSSSLGWRVTVASAFLGSAGTWIYILAAIVGLATYQLIFVLLTTQFRASEETEMFFAVALVGILLSAKAFGRRSIPLDLEWRFLGARRW